ncbi:hypothetical protein LY76DRAFT_671155 [Colletotrichum caudatum]|nr:hypothetical protein LY76DRAFT_671155 [Colletotrichum caudatum]
MTSRISIKNLVASNPVTHTTLDKTEARLEGTFRLQTPPAHDTSSTTNIQHHQAGRQEDVESCLGTTKHAMEVPSLLSPAKLSSSGETNFDDMFWVHMLQYSAVTSSSMALQEQMFEGCGRPVPASYSAQICSICYNASMSGTGNLLEGGRSSGYCVESTQLKDEFTHRYPRGVDYFAYASTVEPLQLWTHGFAAQPISQQNVVSGKGEDSAVAGEQFGPTYVPTAVFAGQITALDY